MDLIKSSLKLGSSKIIVQIISFLSMIYFARVLGSSQLGSYFLLVSLAGMFGLLTNLGMNIATEKRLSEGNNSGELLTSVTVIKLSIILFISSFIIIFRRSINNYIGEELAIFLIIIIFLKSYSSFLNNVLKGELRVGETAETTLGNKISFAVIGLILVSAGFNIIGLVLALITGYLVRLIWLFKKIDTQFGRITKEAIMSIYDYAKNSFIPTISYFIHSWMDILIIGFFLTSSAVGAYEIAWQITAVALIATHAVSKTIFPQISEWHTNGEMKKIEQVIPDALVPALFFVIPAFFGTFLLSDEILGLLYGPEFTIASSALIILMGGKIIRSIRYVVGNVLYGIDRPDLNSRAAIVDIITNFILNIILIWQFGLIGAAIGTVMALALGTMMRTYYLSNILTIRFPYKKTAWCIISAMVMGVAIIFFKLHIEVNSIVVLVTVVLLGALCYFAITMIYTPLRKDVNALRRKLTGQI